MKDGVENVIDPAIFAEEFMDFIVNRKAKQSSLASILGDEIISFIENGIVSTEVTPPPKKSASVTYHTSSFAPKREHHPSPARTVTPSPAPKSSTPATENGSQPKSMRYVVSTAAKPQTAHQPARFSDVTKFVAKAPPARRQRPKDPAHIVINNIPRAAPRAAQMPGQSDLRLAQAPTARVEGTPLRPIVLSVRHDRIVEKDTPVVAASDWAGVTRAVAPTPAAILPRPAPETATPVQPPKPESATPLSASPSDTGPEATSPLQYESESTFIPSSGTSISRGLFSSGTRFSTSSASEDSALSGLDSGMTSGDSLLGDTGLSPGEVRQTVGRRWR
ncbi:hypothetical protein J8273_0584 [Carpediemonas membranifera]|uniref:Uncharacterized protein n=1 Tax=Carpediemonas membranifera TaxID=201153 RepID=A0A8J6B466_9EUKA|nr:hypothetical protein J8273_0584 [Carpediemonas membranifera]|eukprot:KAG9395343.1 hypothetical protein J8273_0584 [Carpediemonas membranifera]